MKNTVLSSIIGSTLAPVQLDEMFVETADELLAKQEYEEALTLLSRMTKLEEVSNHCLTMEGADKQANQLLFATLSGMDYTEEAASGIAAKAASMIKALIIKLKDAFQKYIGAALRGNNARLKQLELWETELKGIPDHIEIDITISGTQVLLYGEDILEDSVNMYGALVPFMNYRDFSNDMLKIFDDLVSGDDGEPDTLKLMRKIGEYSPLSTSTTLFLQRTPKYGFSIIKSHTESPHILMPRRVPVEKRTVRVTGTIDKVYVLRLVQAWMGVIKEAESKLYSTSETKKYYDKWEKIAANTSYTKLSSAILQFISEHGRFESDRIALLQSVISGSMSDLSEEVKALASAAKKVK